MPRIGKAINPFTVICGIFFKGQNCLFGTLVAVCDPALELGKECTYIS